jgi:Transposase DDE domain group 1
MPADRATPLQLAPVRDKAVALDFDGGRLSSAAGLVLRNDPDEPLGFTRALAAVLSDPRDARRGHFPRHDLLTQRVWHMAASYEDANDATTLRHDPLFQLLRGRLPESGASLASQPTISRFANRVSRPELSRMARVLVEPFLASYRRPPKVIVLEVDDTEAPVHGEQAQARYDGYYGGSCFLPLPLYEGLAGRLIPTSRKAKRFTGAPMLAGLKRLVKRRRQAWPDTLRLFRGDRHFASPEVRQWINAHADRSSVTGLTRKNVLKALARQVVDQATRAYARAGGKMTRFHSTRSQAQTWAHPRRVVSKVEGSNPGVNTRFVVTALEQARTQGLYQKIDGARGQAENKSKDHKLYLQSDRTSCHRFEANQCRLL